MVWNGPWYFGLQGLVKLAIDLGWKVPVGFLVSSLEYGPCVIGTWNWFSLSGNGMALDILSFKG